MLQGIFCPTVPPQCLEQKTSPKLLLCFSHIVPGRNWSVVGVSVYKVRRNNVSSFFSQLYVKLSSGRSTLEVGWRCRGADVNHLLCLSVDEIISWWRKEGDG